LIPSEIRDEVLLLEVRLGFSEGGGSIDAAPSLLEHPPRDVRCVHPEIAPHLDAGLQGEHHQRVGLLTAGAAGAPDAQGRSPLTFTTHAELGKDLLEERPQLVTLPEEVGLVGRELIDDVGQLLISGGVLAQHVVIGGEGTRIDLADTAGQALLEQKSRILSEVETAVFAKQIAEHAKLRVREDEIANVVAVAHSS
jgi:hypothetical protein